MTQTPTKQLTAASWPASTRFLKIPGSRHTLRVNLRSLTVTVTLAVLALAVGFWSLTIGDSTLNFSDVLAALRGQADDGIYRVVVHWRLSRITLALLGGAALALSGALFQTLTNNPLGSPDIIGFNTGAYTGALIGMLVFQTSHTGSVLGAMLGGLFTAAMIYLLALRKGLTGFRLIVIGIGISALLGSINTYLLLTAKLESAVSAAIWGAGSINTATWADVLTVAVVLLVCLPFLARLSGDISMLPFGDDVAISRGVQVDRLRRWMILLAVALTAGVASVAGPIAFIALVAPQIAVRMTKTGTIPLPASAMLGALLLVTSDLISRTIVAPTQLPVGTVTVVVGGCYLVWLLINQSRKNRA